MWLIEEAHKVGRDADLVVQGILTSNFAAIHTSSHVCEFSHTYRRIVDAVFVQPEYNALAIQSRRKPAVHPTSARGGRNSDQRTRMDETCYRQVVEARQLHEGVAAPKRDIWW